MSNDEEEEDYMSDAFLAKCADTKPGLLSQSASRKHQKAEKHKEICLKYKTKPVKQLEHEKREEGLNSALDTSNKGFALLQKMGYKPGMSLGKEGNGRIEPVPIAVKTGRSGVGRDLAVKRNQQQVAMMRSVMAAKRVKYEESHRQDFRMRFSERMNDKDVEQDLYSSQKVCQHLDMDANLNEPQKKYYWPDPKVPKSEQDENEEAEEEEEGEAEDDISLTTGEMLSELTMYLRSNYLYCIWCGTRFTDLTDMETNCPGNTSQVH